MQDLIATFEAGLLGLLSLPTAATQCETSSNDTLEKCIRDDLLSGEIGVSGSSFLGWCCPKLLNLLGFCLSRFPHRSGVFHEFWHDKFTSLRHICNTYSYKHVDFLELSSTRSPLFVDLCFFVNFHHKTKSSFKPKNNITGRHSLPWGHIWYKC